MVAGAVGVAEVAEDTRSKVVGAVGAVGVAEDIRSTAVGVAEVAEAVVRILDKVSRKFGT